MRSKLVIFMCCIAGRYRGNNQMPNQLMRFVYVQWNFCIYILLLSVQNKLNSRIILSQTVLSLTKFIKKNTKLVSLDTSWKYIVIIYLFGAIDNITLSYKVGQP